MVKNLQKIFLSFLIFLLFFGVGIKFLRGQEADGGEPSDGEPAAEMATSTEPEVSARDLLEQQIQERAKELEKINQELSVVQKNLNETKTERVGLQKELTTLQYTVNQLNLNIQADETVVKKLGLESQSLTFDVQDIQVSIKDKKAAIAQIFRELQKASQTNLLVIFLKSNSLAEGVFEAQALNDLSTKLAFDIGDLEKLQAELTAKVNELNRKKSKTAFHQKNLEVRKVIVQDQKKERQTLLSETKSKETVFEKQAAELRKLQEKIAEEIESLDAELRTKIDPSLLPKSGTGVLAPPLEGELVITQKYGATNFAQSAYPGKWHNGLDFRAPLGTPIFAAEAGTVMGVGNQDTYCYRGAYGKFVVVNHANNLTTLYTHLSQYIVKKGDVVERGQLIGYSGRTGYATGPHLHFTVFAQPTFYMGQSRSCGPMPYGGDLNPERYL